MEAHKQRTPRKVHAMRVFTAILGTETNTFSPFLTGLENFERTMLVRNGSTWR